MTSTNKPFTIMSEFLANCIITPNSYNVLVHSVKNIYNKNDRRALCQFRMSAHNLQIEKERYLSLSQAEVLCELCNTNNIENE